MIPKIIHYCWLSGEPLPDFIQECIASWKKLLPEYEFRLWDKDSMDYNAIPFTREAFAKKQWAFVSDYVRLYALYHYGGIYLDTDIYVMGKLDKMLNNDFFSGYEIREKEKPGIYIEAAIMGAIPGHPFVKKCLDLYSGRSFMTRDGKMDQTPISNIVSELLERDYDWNRQDKTQHLSDGITIYSTDIIANIHCRRKMSVKLIHLENQSWKQPSFIEKVLGFFHL